MVMSAANNMVEYLWFMSDIPERHTGSMVPMLDIQVWVQHPDLDMPAGADTMAWKFYKNLLHPSKC